MWRHITHSFNQTTNLAIGNHIEFDTILGPFTPITLSTGSGQQRGIITLPQGYYFLCDIVIIGNATSNTNTYQLLNHPADTVITQPNGAAPYAPYLSDPQSADAKTPSSTGFCVVDTMAGEVVMKLDKTTGAAGSIPSVGGNSTNILIEVLN